MPDRPGPHYLYRPEAAARGVVHHATCTRMPENTHYRWSWVDYLSEDEVFRVALNLGLTFCTACDPIAASRREIFYDQRLSVINQAQAIVLMKDVDKRTLRTTKLKFAGYDLMVVSAFVPVDQSPVTHGTFSENPSCWITELVGGPSDIDGRTMVATSRLEALADHDEVVEQAVASGCVLMN